MSSASQQRVILVTGANKGIGFEIVKKLAEESSNNNVILLGSRELKRGQDALVRLGSPSHMHLLQLDLSSRESIARATDEIKCKYGGRLDVVINNAATGELELTVDLAREMFSVNYYGIKTLNEHLFPLMQENGRVVNVASACGLTVLYEASKDLQEKYSLSTLTIEELDRLVEDFISAVGTNSFEELGYNPRSSYLIYSVTKAAVIALTRIEARQWSGAKNVLVLSVCPGFCATDLNKNAPGARPAEFGADSILYVVNAPETRLENGCFYRDGQLLPQIGMMNRKN
ncbi:unnamed protein product [Didymodactylos carnosus]|uniref:Carbonyl reductase n=1 Tax=Didymodactylos carnosus TaxID=1234261 RepID=A0A815B343_9BILA|nr:unnamed protein product [Didymodactylos carnosus]CAF1264986.1 unnamed protein product [Didymodactylos carnosus]CAF3997949.1 unnamed protein product [Didymodactylos carnosus]CAF4046767.1 unnamed protein product [Didymodactylos carnosus]